MKTIPSPGIDASGGGRHGLRRHAFCAASVALTLTAVSSAAQNPGSPSNGGVVGYHPEKDTSVTAVNAHPDANRQMQMHLKHVQALRFAAANAERKRQLSADSDRLVQLCAEMDAELKKAGAPTVPLANQADMIEKLARAIEEKMKLTMAAP